MVGPAVGLRIIIKVGRLGIPLGLGPCGAVRAGRGRCARRHGASFICNTVKGILLKKEYIFGENSLKCQAGKYPENYCYFHGFILQ